ncbi:hypothetical protein PPROV_000982700 [Pycnococcus provasolii]|uniref:Uncharacterized protein n=1 Tax=Pycnococcus provasolii TaxID=41880 RepID=A0A830I1R5_9CHLO|nr:hypothetical protein PPROV_000982700 [Pycnococcus provasolii]
MMAYRQLRPCATPTATARLNRVTEPIQKIRSRITESAWHRSRCAISPCTGSTTTTSGNVCTRASPGEVLAVSTDLVEPVFSTFQLFFLLPFPLMVFLPQNDVTKAIMQSPVVPTVAALLFLTELVTGTVVDYSTTETGAFDAEAWQTDASMLLTEAVKSTSAMREFALSRQHYVGQDWLHVCSWDLIGAVVIYRDGLEKSVTTRHSVLLCQVLGPVGWISHALTTSLTRALRGEARGS